METRIYERERLYKEVWEEPMTSLAKRYGISDVALRKQCKKMEIPLPKAGHWTKVKAGHKIKIPSLPKSDVPHKIVVSDYTGNTFSRTMNDVLLHLPEEQRQRAIQYCLSLAVSDKLRNPHDLIKEAKQYYKSRHNKNKLSRNVLDTNVSNELKERTYKFYNALFKALEHLGYSIVVNESRNQGYYRRNELIVRLNEDNVPIYIKEKQKRIEHKPTKEELERRHSFIPSYDYMKTGKLHFGIDSYHAKRKNWHDTEARFIENQIGEIVVWIMEAIHVEKTIREKREAEKRQRLEQQHMQQEMIKKKEEELKQFELLNQQAMNWEKANRIRRFANAIELEFSGQEKEEIYKWLKWIRDTADSLDPLVKLGNEQFGEGYSLFKCMNSTRKEEF